MSNHPFVYVLTLNFNQPFLTIKCVESVLASDYPNIKIMVVDNGSSPESRRSIEELIDKRVCIHYLNKNLGYVGGMNYALENASLESPDYFLIMNNDTVIDKGAIKALISTAQKSDNKCIVTGKVYHFDKPEVIQYIGSYLLDEEMLKFVHIGVNQVDTGQFEKESERDLIDDIYWLLPMEVYLRIGGYNKLFYFNGESADYCLRAKKEKFNLLYTPSAKLWHKGGASIGGRENNPLLGFFQTKSTLLLRYIHLNRSNFYIFYFRIFLTSLKKLIKGVYQTLYLKKGSLKSSLGEIRGWISFTYELCTGRYK